MTCGVKLTVERKEEEEEWSIGLPQFRSNHLETRYDGGRSVLWTFLLQYDDIDTQSVTWTEDRMKNFLTFE